MNNGSHVSHVSIFEQVFFTLIGLYFPFALVYHSGLKEEIKGIVFFFFLSVFVGIISRIFYLRKRKRFALELALFYGGFNLFLAFAAYYACFMRLAFYPEISLLEKTLEVVLVYCSPVIGFIFVYYSIKKLMDINQV